MASTRAALATPRGGARPRSAPPRRSRRRSPTAWRSSRARACSRAWRSAGSGASRGRGTGTETRLATVASGLTRSIATRVSAAWTSATSHSGTAKRTVRDSASMSLVVRLRRSPVPARSTVARGRAEHAREELLAQLGEDPLAQDVAATAREEREAGVGERRDEEPADVERDPRSRSAGASAAKLVIWPMIHAGTSARPRRARRGRACARARSGAGDQDPRVAHARPRCRRWGAGSRGSSRRTIWR